MADLALPVENGAYRVGAGSILAQLGLEEIANYIEDDWDDNSLTNRTSPDDGIFSHPDANEAGDIIIGRYRPEWFTNAGSPSASGGEMIIASSSDTSVSTSSNLDTGYWKLDFRLTSSSSGGFYNMFNHVAVNGYFRYENNVTDNKSVLLDAGGDFILGSGAYSGTATHTLEITEDSFGNAELFEDGTSQGTGTKTSLSGVSSFIIYSSSADSDMAVDNLVVN